MADENPNAPTVPNDVPQKAAISFVLPGAGDFEGYKASVVENVERIFNVSTPDARKGLGEFLVNCDHGARHTFNVFSKSLDIAGEVEAIDGSTVDKELLYLMSLAHDSGRFHLSANEKKRMRCERHHNRCGVGQVRLAVKRMRAASAYVDQKRVAAMEDYVFNHDYFNARIDGAGLKEPASIEGQIVRLADRISTPIEEEVRRYWETGKRLKTPYFKKEVALSDRISFSFPRIKEFIVSGKFDEFTFFLALLSMSEDDFSHPVLKGIYREWATTKNVAVSEILAIASEEGYPQEDIELMRRTLDDYAKHFNISL